jgi:hypothetical protein
MIAAENRVVSVSSVIHPVDTFAPTAGVLGPVHFALAPIKESVPAQNRRPIRHAGDLVVFTDLAPGEYAVTVSSNYYFPSEIAILVSELIDFDKPLVVVEMLPAPWYPFAPYATLLRGSVTDAETARPIAGATVIASYKAEMARSGQIETEVTRTYTASEGFYYGSYALPFKILQLDPSARRATPSDLQAQIEVESKGYLRFVSPLAIPLHKTTYLDVKLTPG